MAEKKIAVVTGASRGIGRAVALELAHTGAFVVVNYCGSKEKAEEVLGEIREAGGDGVTYQCDVSDFAACESFVGDVIKTYGRIDILVNNAGITKDGLIMRMSDGDFSDVLQVNLAGTFNCIRHVSRYMIKQKYGRIVNMASVVGISGNAGQANYAASKAGVIGLSKSVAKELASRGVTVNVVAPGYIQTDMTDVLSDKVKDSVKQMIPLGTFGQTEDIAKAVAFLASDDARYITGQVLCVDGGMAM